MTWMNHQIFESRDQRALNTSGAQWGHASRASMADKPELSSRNNRRYKSLNTALAGYVIYKRYI